MTIIERINNIINNPDSVDISENSDTIEKLILAAYMFGYEDATVKVSDTYSKHMQEQTERAKACRYYNMALEILDNGPGYIYTADYRMGYHESMSYDETNL